MQTIVQSRQSDWWCADDSCVCVHMRGIVNQRKQPNNPGNQTDDIQLTEECLDWWKNIKNKIPPPLPSNPPPPTPAADEADILCYKLKVWRSGWGSMDEVATHAPAVGRIFCHPPHHCVTGQHLLVVHKIPCRPSPSWGPQSAKDNRRR